MYVRIDISPPMFVCYVWSACAYMCTCGVYARACVSAL